MKDEFKGRITASVGGRYNVRIYTHDGISVGACARFENDTLTKIPCRGAFRHDKITPLVGDIVSVVYDGKSYVIDSIEPRKNELIRPPMANIDTLFIVVAAACPAPTAELTDKMTVICEKNGIIPVIIVTKTELNRQKAAEIVSEYSDCGYKSIEISTLEGYNVDTVAEYISSFCTGISAFAGASGVGKSTLLNALYPQLNCEVGEISEKIERGKNTTRKVSLYELHNGAFIADTPGFGLLDFEHFDFCDRDELPFLFPEFLPLLGKCKYTKCSHTKEDGCVIRKAVEDGEISSGRYSSFLGIRDAIKDKEPWKRTT